MRTSAPASIVKKAMPRTLFSMVIAAALSSFQPAHAENRLLLESDADAPGNAEVYLVSYADDSGFMANNIVSQGFSQLDINANFSLADFAYDGSYHALLESNIDANGGEEIYLLNYQTIDDIVNNNINSQQFLPLDLNAAFSVGGFTFDQSRYLVLLESDSDQPGGSEIYLLTYNSWAELLANNISTQQFLPLDLNTTFSVGGFAYDNGLYDVLLESNADANGGSEVYRISYASFADLLANNIDRQGFSQLDINTAFSIGGYEVDTNPPGGGAVPEPATWAMMLLGFAGVGIALRRRPTGAAPA